jgi:hypothetical protein
VAAGESPEYRRLAGELGQAQDDASRQLEHAQRSRAHRRRPRIRTDPRLWALKWVFSPVFGVLFLIVGAVEIGPAVTAAQGHGAAGYFVAEAEHCGKGGCSWTGDFVGRDNRVTRQNVGFMGPHGVLYRGDRLAALDTGAPGAVYARHGSRDWLGDLALLVAGALVLGLWTWRMPYRLMRRRARGDAFLVPEA